MPLGGCFGARGHRELGLEDLEFELVLEEAEHVRRQLDGSAPATTDSAIPEEELERWLEEARGLDSALPREAWGLGILDELADNINSRVLSNTSCWMPHQPGVFHDRIKLRELKRSFQRLRGPDSPVGGAEKRINKMLRTLPKPSERETQEMQTVERDHALLKTLREIPRFLEMRLERRQTPSITGHTVGRTRRTISTFDSAVAEIHDIMSTVIKTAEKYLDHLPKYSLVSSSSASAEPGAKTSILKRPSKHIPITNDIEQDISWVLTTTTHKVSYEVGIDGIRLGMDGVDIGAVLKVTRADGEGEVLTQKGSVAAWGNMNIPVTHRNDHFITIFDKTGLHCENMPTKAGRTIRVKDEVYFERFRRTANESNEINTRETQGWWQTILSYFRS